MPIVVQIVTQKILALVEDEEENVKKEVGQEIKNAVRQACVLVAKENEPLVAAKHAVAVIRSWERWTRNKLAPDEREIPTPEQEASLAFQKGSLDEAKIQLKKNGLHIAFFQQRHATASAVHQHQPQVDFKSTDIAIFNNKILVNIHLCR